MRTGTAFKPRCEHQIEELESRNLLSTYLTNLTFDSPVATMHASLGISVTAYAQQGVRAVSFFLDNNNDGRWTAGIDRTLGDVWTGSSATTATVTKRVTIDGGWSGVERVVADALDWTGRWSGNPVSRTIPVETSPPPATLSANVGLAEPGDTILLTAVAQPGHTIRAASFFVDMNSDGRWTAGTDLALGDVTSPVAGTNNMFRLASTVQWAWGIGFQSPSQVGFESRSIGVNVVSASGSWSTVASMVSLTISPTPTVTTFKVGGDASVVTFNASTRSPGASGWYAIVPPSSNIVQSVRFFHDANMNGRHDWNETFLGSANPTGTGSTFALSAGVDSNWAWPRMFGAYTIDSAGRAGDVRSVLMYAPTTTPADVPATVTKMRFASVSRVFSNQLWWIEGETVRLEVAASVNTSGTTGISLVTVWNDENVNGLPDAGESIIATRFAGNAPSIAFEITFQSSGQGMRHLSAITTDSRGRLGSAMGQMFLVTRPVQFAGNPTWIVENAGTGRFLRIDVDAATNSHILRIDALLDTGQYGRVYAPATGNSASGRYTVRINLAGVTPGAHSMNLIGVNAYAATSTLPFIVYV